MTLQNRRRFGLIALVVFLTLGVLATLLHSKALDWASLATLVMAATALYTKRFAGPGLVETGKNLRHIPLKRPVTTAIVVAGLVAAVAVPSVLLAVASMLVAMLSRENRDQPNPAHQVK
jgi:hypothetical protein